jgi:hypothetical protein
VQRWQRQQQEQQHQGLCRRLLHVRIQQREPELLHWQQQDVGQPLRQWCCNCVCVRRVAAGVSSRGGQIALTMALAELSVLSELSVLADDTCDLLQPPFLQWLHSFGCMLLGLDPACSCTQVPPQGVWHALHEALSGSTHHQGHVP